MKILDNIMVIVAALAFSPIIITFILCMCAVILLAMIIDLPYYLCTGRHYLKFSVSKD